MQKSNRETGKRENEEEYWFLQETIRPQRKRQVFLFVWRLLATICLAVVFGVVGAVAFRLTQDALANRDEAEKRERLLAEQTVEDDSLEEEESGDSVGSISSYEKYRKKMAAIGEKCNQAVVAVYAGRTESWYQRSGKDEALQSGLIFQKKDQELYLLTAASDIIQAKSIAVEFFDGEAVEAELVKADDTLKIAVLRVDTAALSEETKKDIRIMELEQSDETLNLDLNELVLAFGAPNGILYSVFPGSIVNSALSAGIPDGELRLYCTDIDYNPEGNGFIANMEGDIVGMITNSYTDVSGDTNCTFMSVSDIADVALRLAQGQSIVRLGVRGCSVKKECLRAEYGVYVKEVAVQSPAYHGGLRVADVIVEIDGCRIDNMQDLRICLLTHSPGDKVTIQVLRGCDKKQMTKELEVTLE